MLLDVKKELGITFFYCTRWHSSRIPFWASFPKKILILKFEIQTEDLHPKRDSKRVRPGSLVGAAFKHHIVMIQIQIRLPADIHASVVLQQLLSLLQKVPCLLIWSILVVVDQGWSETRLDISSHRSLEGLDSIGHRDSVRAILNAVNNGTHFRLTV